MPDQEQTGGRAQFLPSDEAALQPSRPAQASEWQRARDTEGVVCQTHIGGQALLEGVMMRGRYNWALAVRRPDGTIYTEQHDLASGRKQNSWMYWPVIRGCTALVESLTLGYQALQTATENALLDEEGEGAPPASEPGSEPAGQAAQQSPTQLAGGDAAPMPAPPDQAPTPGCPTLAEPPAVADPLADATPPLPPPPSAGSEEPPDAGIPKPLLTLSMALGLALGVVIFVGLPALLTNLLVGDLGQNTLLWNLVDGVLRIAIFVAYIGLIGRVPDIARMFGYHGAEHRTIHCYEHGLPLTPANAALFSTLHVRCGTAFMLMTMLIAILVFTVVPVAWLIDALGVQGGPVRLVLVVLSRILLMPLIAGLSYEVTVKWAGARPDNPWVQAVLWPGLQLQRLTTRKPDDGQVECAIAAMRLVLEREQREAATS